MIFALLFLITSAELLINQVPSPDIPKAYGSTGYPPNQRYSMGIATSNEELFIYGGSSNDPEVWKYSISSKTWSAFASKNPSMNN